jgi:histidinol-phosphate aminotransferase
MLPSPRPGILDIQAYVGGDASAPGADRVIRLASNENPLGPSPRAVAAYGAEHDELNRYPEGDSGALRQTIAGAYDLPADRLVCGAGSDELIGLLVRAYAGPGDEVLHSAHGFLMYPLAAKAAGATPVSAPERNLTSDVDALLGLAGPKTRLVFLANPNNPTGSYLPAAELGRLRAGLPEQVLLVIDAAYAEYVERADYEPGIALVRAHDNVVMTRTFSKIHGLASLRLGWAFCPQAVADVLNRVRGPFNVSGPAQAAGIAALADGDHLARSRSHNSRWLAWFSAQAAGLGLEVAPSVGNFVLLRFPKQPGKDAASAAAALKREGILVRAMGAYGLSDCLRVTIGTGEDMETVVQALGAFLS